jgi:hypothetical protein
MRYSSALRRIRAGEVITVKDLEGMLDAASAAGLPVAFADLEDVPGYYLMARSDLYATADALWGADA